LSNGKNDGLLGMISRGSKSKGKPKTGLSLFEKKMSGRRFGSRQGSDPVWNPLLSL
jgi:hypothetical protein